ncbi:MAG: VWA domain-containing protein [Planctomycetaceae bacterium]|jgi:uncharacterized membrane protein|nr:VWA domain-containing protein [Planctomycetaceae bacterium]
MFRFSFYPLFGYYWVVFGLALAIGAVLLSIRPAGERLPRTGQTCLMVLRFTAFFLLLFGMLRPTLVYTKSQQLASTLNILLDQSESMSRPDELGGNTRFQLAKESLLQAVPQLKRLQSQAEINVFAFDSSLVPLEIRDGLVENFPEQPKGKETALGAALDAVRNISSGKRILGTILLSDGTQRTRPPRDILPQDAATRFRDAGIPLYTVPFGQATGTPDIQDIAVNDLQANDRVFVKNVFLVSGSLRITGYRNKPVPVQLFFEEESGSMKLVSEIEVQSKDDGLSIPFRLSYAPPKAGYFKYTVLVPTQEKELIETNNQQSHFVRVIDGGLTVLFIQGERNMEQGLLMQSLNASADIRVDYRPIRVGKIGVGGQKGESFQTRLERFTRERPAWTEDVFKPGEYNVYLLGDLDSKAFKPEELQALADRVREGAGLMMLGGYHAFAAGGYAETPLADISPIELRNVDRQPLDAPIRQDIHLPETIPISIFLTPEGRRHYVLRLTPNPDKNAELWASLPPLLGANRFGKLKPGASLLAVGSEDQKIDPKMDQKIDPKTDQKILVSQLFGLGRVLAFAGDSTYRWRLAGFVEEHKRFWRQVVLWLAKMESVMEGDCWITLDQVRLLPGETAKFQVFLQSPDGNELQNIAATATVIKPDGMEERVVLVNEEGTPTGSFRSTDAAGDYTIRVEASHESLPPDAATRQATARFMVYDRNLELDSPVAYPQLLRNISELTGGRSVAPEQLGSLLNELITKSNELVEKRETKQSLFDSWGLLLAFILILCFEWFLRKYWGLV